MYQLETAAGARIGLESAETKQLDQIKKAGAPDQTGHGNSQDHRKAQLTLKESHTIIFHHYFPGLGASNSHACYLPWIC